MEGPVLEENEDDDGQNDDKHGKNRIYGPQQISSVSTDWLIVFC